MQGCWASLGCDLTEGKGEEVREIVPLPRPPTHLVWMGGQKALGPLLSLLTLSLLSRPPGASFPVFPIRKVRPPH